ncbi:HAMP domain-containing sensor histidine kinase [Agrobacterium pusense]|uniref:HAMP domain-containing sensor histidine kinase n=1 Tax=Agrobacterium pusense TaxID=648995 RepID=UPI0028B06A5C|nr:ATP-binding protein [Agrobacterium pusense]
MRRLFWKFFAIIWLTMAGATAAVFTVSNLFDTSPLLQKVVRQQQFYTLDLATQIAAHDGEAAVRRFAEVAARTEKPVHLAVRAVGETEDCSGEDPRRTRFVSLPSGCFRLEILTPDVGVIKEFWPKLVLWASVLIASALSAYSLAKYLIRPVGHLRYGLSALSQGRFDVRIGDKMAGRRDEVAALAHDFDASAERLQELHDSQQRLFHDVSHEFRSPLSRLQAAISLTRQNPAKTAVMLDRMDREIGRIDELIGEILTLARLTSSTRRRLDLQTLDVMDLLNEILEDAGFEGQTRNISISKSLDETFITQVDGELIYRAIENVVRNAVKYAYDGSQVEVKTSISNEALHITISNNGPNVPDRELETIFQPFSRASNNEMRDGHGLGLAITKHAFERHGGHVFAGRLDKGGLVVTLVLPRATEAQAHH